MKKIILFTAILFLWAGSTFAADLPPYSESYSFSPFYFEDFQQPETGVQMYPNPVTEGRLTIKSEESFNLIQIMNITGEIVFTQAYPSGSNSEVIELNNLQKGMYLVRIGFAGKPNHTAKIIIK
jgi:hypothetical protein